MHRRALDRASLSLHRRPPRPRAAQLVLSLSFSRRLEPGPGAVASELKSWRQVNRLPLSRPLAPPPQPPCCTPYHGRFWAAGGRSVWRSLEAREAVAPVGQGPLKYVILSGTGAALAFVVLALVIARGSQAPHGRRAIAAVRPLRRPLRDTPSPAPSLPWVALVVPRPPPFYPHRAFALIALAWYMPVVSPQPGRGPCRRAAPCTPPHSPGGRAVLGASPLRRGKGSRPADCPVRGDGRRPDPFVASLKNCLQALMLRPFNGDTLSVRGPCMRRRKRLAAAALRPPHPPLAGLAPSSSSPGVSPAPAPGCPLHDDAHASPILPLGKRRQAAWYDMVLAWSRDVLLISRPGAIPRPAADQARAIHPAAMFAGLEPVDAGDGVWATPVLSRPVTPCPPKNAISMNFQDFALLPAPHALAIPAFGLAPPCTRDAAPSHAMVLASALGAQQRYPHERPAANSKRVAIARA